MKNFIILIFIVSTGLNAQQTQQKKDSCYKFFITNSVQYTYDHDISNSPKEFVELKQIGRYKNLVWAIKADTMIKTSLGYSIISPHPVSRFDILYGIATFNDKKPLFTIGVRGYKEYDKIIYFSGEGLMIIPNIIEFNLSAGISIKNTDLYVFFDQESYGIGMRQNIINTTGMRISNYLMASCFTKTKDVETGIKELHIIKFFFKVGLSVSFGG